jgi:hypothetical protein
MTRTTRTIFLLSLLAGMLLLIVVGCQEPARPIIACIEAEPTIGYAPVTIAFDAACSFVPPERAGVYDYRWEFGDGTDASGRSAIHTFSAPGTYEVGIYIFDFDMGVPEVLAYTKRVITVLPVP